MRFDAGMGIRLGHLVDLLAVAVELVARGCAVTVATRTVAPEFLARSSSRCSDPSTVSGSPESRCSTARCGSLV